MNDRTVWYLSLTTPEQRSAFLVRFAGNAPSETTSHRPRQGAPRLSAAASREKTGSAHGVPVADDDCAGPGVSTRSASEARTLAAAASDTILLPAASASAATPGLPLSDSDPVIVGPFRMLGRLGAGGMGVVYLAEGSDGALAAVKVVRPELAADAQFRARFEREVRAVSSLHEPYTARVVGSDVAASQQWVATEYVPGPTLDRYVEEHGPLHPFQAHLFAMALAEALRSIHARQLVHRDLKPSNIVLSADGPRIIDFGVARAADETSLTQTGALTGSLAWMAPEQLTGGELGPATDLFAWGLVVSYAALGRHPYGQGAPAAIAFRMAGLVPDLRDLPPGLQSIVASALTIDPSQRMPAADLVRTLAGAPAHATEVAPAPVPAAAPRRRRGGRAVLASLAAGSLAVGAVAGAAILGRDSTGGPSGGSYDEPAAAAPAVSTPTQRIAESAPSVDRGPFSSTCTWTGRGWDDIYSGYYDTFEADCAGFGTITLTHDNADTASRGYVMTGEVDGRPLTLQKVDLGESPDTWSGYDLWEGTFDGAPVSLKVALEDEAFVVLPGSRIGDGEITCTGPALVWNDDPQSTGDYLLWDNRATVTGEYGGDARVSRAEAAAICNLAAAELPARGFTGYLFE